MAKTYAVQGDGYRLADRPAFESDAPSRRAGCTMTRILKDGYPIRPARPVPSVEARMAAGPEGRRASGRGGPLRRA